MFAFPDMNKSFNMYTALVEEFNKNGHDVFVVAPGNKKTKIEIEAGIRVLRVKTMPIKNVPNFIKGIANLLLPYQYKKAVRKFYNADKLDLIVIPTPPITLINLAIKLKSEFGSKIYLILRDIFPQNAVDMGFMTKGSLLYKYFRNLEIKLYDNSDYVGCMSQGNIDYILGHNKIQSDKLHIFRNLQKEYNFSKPVRADLRTKYKLEGKFVAVFGGNIGKPQKLENVLTLAKRCEIFQDVVFLILGEGTQKKNLEILISKNRIKNILTLNTIPKQDYQDLLRQCEIGLISLHENFTIPNIPSKTLDYFNVGVPVLASIDSATDYGKILDKAEAGLWSYAGDHDKFFSNFELLYMDSAQRKKMGENGRKYFKRNLTPQIQYELLIKRVSYKKHE